MIVVTSAITRAENAITAKINITNHPSQKSRAVNEEATHFQHTRAGQVIHLWLGQAEWNANKRPSEAR